MFAFRFFSGFPGRLGLNYRGLATACTLLLALAFAPPASAQDAVDFDIPSQNLSTALTEYARQSGLEMLYSPEIVAGKTSTAVSGGMARPDALDLLLQGTGLEFEQTPSGGMMVGDEAALRAYRAEQAALAGQSTIGKRRPGIEEIIVTGQKREERIQDVPIAISAFSPEDLHAQKIEGGFDLLKGVPNVTFSKTNFTSYNFQIRGIGTQAISATTDPGVAVSFNNTTLIVNRLFEQEYLDVERVEVLRGPQGTLFGRNATGGVINVISAKPEMGVWDGELKVEVGNFNARRLRGMFNAPIGDTLAVRGAYASTKRDGYGTNLAASEPFADVRSDVDGRDLWTGRLSLGWQPNDRFRANLIWERFEEDDNRVRTSKQLCHRDPTPDSVGSVPLPDEDPEVFNAIHSQGCQAGSLYTDEAFGTPNGASLPYITGSFFSQVTAALAGIFVRGDLLSRFGVGPNPFAPVTQQFLFAGQLDDPADAPCPDVVRPNYSLPTYSINVCQPDPYGGRMQSRDLREIYSLIEPEYRAEADIFEFSFDYDWTDSLTLSSQTVYVKDEIYATQDFNRFTTVPLWNGTGAANACGAFLLSFFGSGFPAADCSNNPDTGRGTFLPLTDEDGDGVIDQGLFGPVADTDYNVDGGGFLRDEEGNRVGYYNHMYNNGGENIYCDPQLGCSDKLVAQDLSEATSTQYNQELRLISSFDGAWNFSLGANYTKFRTLNDYYVFSNAFSQVLHFWPFNNSLSPCPVGSDPEGRALCRYMDPNPLEDIDGEGHNYFRSSNPYELTSSAIFGELYWKAAETVKVTLGLRMNWDQKVFTPRPSQLLLTDYRSLGEGGFSPIDINPGDPPPEPDFCRRSAPDCPFSGNAIDGRGSPSSPNIVQEWNEPTGRLVVDWSPELAFTDETMVYASFSHGYKGGGANPPGVAPPSGLILAAQSGGAAPPTFEPEFINAYEIGTKNTLFGGALILNGTAFYYDYTDYQVSKIVDRSAANENFDAENLGAELEVVFAPSLDWQFNAAIGWLKTEIADGEQSIDLMDRAQGGNQSFTGENGHTYDSWVVVKPWVTAASNCVVPTELLEHYIQTHGAGRQPEFFFCPSGYLLGTEFPLGGEGFSSATPPGVLYDPRVDAPNASAGFFADLGGKELPNAPEFTVALGGQYNFDLTRDWRATARVDYYWQDESFARVYNTEFDRLKSWSNTNLSFWIVNENNGITVEGYVKNVFDETPITGTFLNSDDAGLTTNVFTLDPRLIGVSIRKEF